MAKNLIGILFLLSLADSQLNPFVGLQFVNITEEPFVTAPKIREANWAVPRSSDIFCIGRPPNDFAIKNLSFSCIGCNGVITKEMISEKTKDYSQYVDEKFKMIKLESGIAINKTLQGGLLSCTAVVYSVVAKGWREREIINTVPIYVNYLEKPQISTEHSIHQQNENEIFINNDTESRVKLYCNVDGKPTPTSFSWSRNENPILRINGSAPNSTLTIDNTYIGQEITCSANNGLSLEDKISEPVKIVTQTLKPRPKTLERIKVEGLDPMYTRKKSRQMSCNPEIMKKPATPTASTPTDSVKPKVGSPQMRARVGSKEKKVKKPRHYQRSKTTMHLKV